MSRREHLADFLRLALDLLAQGLHLIDNALLIGSQLREDLLAWGAEESASRAQRRSDSGT
jgi:hypothetical protein